MTSSTAATPGPYDPLDKALPDEPVFTLVGRDKHAPATVLHWVDLFRAESLQIDDPDVRKAELIKATDAEMISADMIRWRRGHPEHDITTPKRASYSGIVQSVAEMDEAQRKATLLQMVAYLREAAFYTSEASTGLIALGVLSDQDVFDLGLALGHVNRIADNLTPKRPGIQPQLKLPESRAPDQPRSDNHSTSVGHAGDHEEIDHG